MIFTEPYGFNTFNIIFFTLVVYFILRAFLFLVSNKVKQDLITFAQENVTWTLWIEWHFVIFAASLLMCYVCLSFSSWASSRGRLHMPSMALVLSLLGGFCQLLFQHLIPSPWSVVIKLCIITTQFFALAKCLQLIIVLWLLSAAPKDSGNRGPWVYNLVWHTLSSLQGNHVYLFIRTRFIVKIVSCGIINHLVNTAYTCCTAVYHVDQLMPLKSELRTLSMCRKTEMSC